MVIKRQSKLFEMGWVLSGVGEDCCQNRTHTQYFSLF